MKKLLILLLCCSVLLVCCVGFSDCKKNPYPYRGEYKELYTVAVYSIPDAEGYMHHGEGAYNSDIYVWEQDDYGRILFSYCEDYGNEIFALVISQAYDKTNVYFYPDTNYVLTMIDSEYLYEGAKDDHLKNRTEDFYLKSKEKLKEQNDWNKPLDKTKCVSYPITDHKDLGKKIYSLKSHECNKILNETMNFSSSAGTPHRYNKVLQVDAEGKILHEIYGIYRLSSSENNGHSSHYVTLWVITDKEGNYDKENGVLVMYSDVSSKEFIYNAEDILAFKNKNNWKNVYCDE
ncbi:MAG: hypothetical protein E7629_00660 [Ruminococcaceae bacterium]|nr:hypothetical protein [Oscillospiraceae bacterium]